MINLFPVIKENICIIFSFNNIGNKIEWLSLPNIGDTTNCVKIYKSLLICFLTNGTKWGKSW